MAKVKVDQEKCIGCGACVDAAPNGTFEMRDGKSVAVKEDDLEGGELGKSVCPVDAISTD